MKVRSAIGSFALLHANDAHALEPLAHQAVAAAISGSKVAAAGEPSPQRNASA